MCVFLCLGFKYIKLILCVCVYYVFFKDLATIEIQINISTLKRFSEQKHRVKIINCW